MDAITSGSISIRARIAAIAAVFLVPTGACNLWEEQHAVQVVNDTNQALIVVASSPDGNEIELATIEPGEKYSERTSDCEPLELAVRTTQGDLYARQPHQLCADDVWTITQPDP